MCGIAGWINLQADLRDKHEVLESMSEKLAARGPDASGLWMSENAALAHRRLIVVDPEGGSQPMIRRLENRTYVLTYNGELYNTADLRRELEDRGHVFTSNSDTEVLLVSYMEWGSNCTSHLNGIFAFAVWDDYNRSLFMARDRFGVKPLFYAERGSSMIFGSELKALLAHPYINADIDAEGLAEIFALGPSRTPGHGIYKDVYELKPAHCLIYNAYGLKVRPYWSLESRPHEDDVQTTIDKVRELVCDSIKRQLVADVPVSTFLSGGLDSSAITALAANTFREEKNYQLHTYSIDYVNNEKYFKPSAFQPNSDAPWVKLMSEHFNTQHHFINFDTSSIVAALRDAVLAKDIPGMADVDSSLLLFCKEIKRGATVTLSGECADEVFGGYPWFHRQELLEAGTFPWMRFLDERTKVYSSELNNLIKADEYVSRRYNETLAEVPRLENEDRLEARRREIFYLNITWFMATLLDRKDRMSMANGLEVRVPFCDHRLVEYVWNIPWSMKALEGREKGILRKALADLLPDEIVTRKKSPYPKTHNPSYEAEVKKWLLEILNDSSSPLLPLVNRDIIFEIAKAPSDYGRPWFGQLMATPQLFAYLIQAEIWMREYKVRIV